MGVFRNYLLIVPTVLIKTGENRRMLLYCILSGLVFFGMFVLFLVLSKTLNNILNNLVKLQYLLQKELDFKKEQLAIKNLMDEEKAAESAAKEAAADEEAKQAETNEAVKK
jgi:hypothetical protein